jgi:hypothetical protein
MCEHRSKAKSSGWNCGVRFTRVTQVTCDACEHGPGTRKHIREHPRAKARKLPQRPGEAKWLKSLNLQPRTHDG